ncbi:thioredoxin-like protein [Punctularia strigosozonata HHB-11173 SS5]|uniref:thioredoxin-like protein n=1 Tax=Punctularia strigosozonata (strain HHB-11173) TaxID=741275 RepID=UPI0004417428|nr:thioredoxin-like protein [Punctularia strigosozonata HHB-11173 SS5]EIN11266.1 thioredoxin-like protein [Punctularia strigosozonata HHB-11173 SS5]
MSGKDVTLWTHEFAPNGWKVVCVLNLLGLSYESKYVDFSKQEQKSEEHLKLNPNGRIPTLIDHKNGDFVVWESNAILLYLVDTYDKEHEISVTGLDRFTLNQWLFFQASGQGFHSEKIPSAVERYQKEILRVLGVLESVLSKREWLVGGKMTIADISFVLWNEWAIWAFPTLDPAKNIELDMPRDFPAVDAWHKKMTALPEIKEPLAERARNLLAFRARLGQ